MGVIRTIASLQNSGNDSIEDVLDQIEEQTQTFDVEVRRTRRIRHRPNKVFAVGDTHISNKTGGKKKRQRFDNANFLLSLADPEETFELSIHDFVAPSISVFCQLHLDQDNLEIWHEFINCTDHEAWLQGFVMPQNQLSNGEESIGEASAVDNRKSNPAFAAAECYQRIDSDLRLALKKKHVPMGALSYLERELLTFFMNRPQSIYHSQIPNSFERLLLHALCQYMNLGALSYNRNGARWTRVRNNNPTFEIPLILLSSYLEQRMQRNRQKH